MSEKTKSKNAGKFAAPAVERPVEVVEPPVYAAPAVERPVEVVEPPVYAGDTNVSAVEPIDDAEYTVTDPPDTGDPGTALVLARDQALASLEGAQPVSGGRYRLAYVQYRSPKTRKTAPLDAAGVDPETFYLYDSEVLRVKPYQYHLIEYKVYGTKQNGAGLTVAVRPGWDQSWKQEGFKQSVYAFVLVRFPDAEGKVQALIPASWQTSNALTQAVFPAAEFRDKASNERVAGFAARSAAHAIAAKAKWPAGRYFGTAWGISEATQDGEYDFNKGVCSVRPTDEVGVELFNEMVGPLFEQVFVPAYNAHQKRLAYWENNPSGRAPQKK